MCVLREASEVIEQLIKRGAGREALVRAKQALDILATLEELGEDLKVVLAPHAPRVALFRGRACEMFNGDGSLVDALGQLCQVLEMEKDQ